jgi:hypothetical protein
MIEASCGSPALGLFVLLLLLFLYGFFTVGGSFSSDEPGWGTLRAKSLTQN